MYSKTLFVVMNFYLIIDYSGLAPFNMAWMRKGEQGLSSGPDLNVMEGKH